MQDTQLIIHWENIPHNFVNKERGLSSKHRVGHKSNTMTQTTSLTVARERLDQKFKQMLEKELLKHSALIRKNVSCRVFVNGKLFIASCRNAKTFSNNIVNLLLMDRFNKKVDISKQIF